MARIRANTKDGKSSYIFAEINNLEEMSCHYRLVARQLVPAHETYLNVRLGMLSDEGRAAITTTITPVTSEPELRQKAVHDISW